MPWWPLVLAWGLAVPGRQATCDPGPPLTILTPAALTLRHAPIADCARYDLRRTL